MPVDWKEVNDRRIGEISQEIMLYCSRRASEMTPRSFELAIISMAKLLDNIAERNWKFPWVARKVKESIDSQNSIVAVCDMIQALSLAKSIVYNKIGDNLNLYPITASQKLAKAKNDKQLECDIPSDELTEQDMVYIAYARTQGESISTKTFQTVIKWFEQHGLGPIEALVYSVYQYTKGGVSISSLAQQSILGSEYKLAAKSLVKKGYLNPLDNGLFESTGKSICNKNNKEGDDEIEKDIYFDRNDADTWALARFHHSLLKEIQDSPLWQPEEVPDIPLTEEQMLAFVKGYGPDFDCRYAPFLLGGWFYITRSGHWLKKFKYTKGADGFYHVSDHYTTEKEKGRNLLMEIIMEGYFEPRIFDDRLRELYDRIYHSHV